MFGRFVFPPDTPSSVANEKDPKPRQLVFFCHGGGWVMANRWSNEPILCKYALQTNSILTYVNYRLAPEYKHPTAVYDCYDCLKYLLAHKDEFHIDEKQVVLMGDSAGGMICFIIAQLARDEAHRNLFKKMVLIYPAMDNRKVPDDDPSWDERNMIYSNTFGLQYKTGEIMSRWYFPSWDSVNSPLGSPIVCEDFSNFPPVRCGLSCRDAGISRMQNFREPDGYRSGASPLSNGCTCPRRDQPVSNGKPSGPDCRRTGSGMNRTSREFSLWRRN